MGAGELLDDRGGDLVEHSDQPPAARLSDGRIADVRNDAEGQALYLKELDTAGRSPSTLRKYRTHIGRFLEWLQWERGGQTIAASGRETLIDYRRFLADPPKHWIRDKGREKVSRCQLHQPDHRLLGPSSTLEIQRQERLLFEWFGYLVTVGYLTANPIPPGKSLRVQATRAERESEGDADEAPRFFDDAQWAAIQDVLPDLDERFAARGMRKPVIAAERARWVVAALYGWALRSFELTGQRMGDVRRVTIHDYAGGAPVWSLRVIGKGNKKATIPCSAEVIEALMRYRHAMGWSPMPGAEERTPLVTTLAGNKRLQPRQVYNIVGAICREAADAIEADNPDSAAHLRAAGTHRFRHTRNVHLERAGVARHLRRTLMRHEKDATLDIYSHPEMRELADVLRDPATHWKRDRGD